MRYLFLLPLLGLPLATLADGSALVQQQCAACHALSAPQEQTLTERQTRKAPPLHYAGNKFRRDWLAGWLQQPVRLRPAGEYPPAHTINVGEAQQQLSWASGIPLRYDAVDVTSLTEHPALSAEQAEAATDYLMTLRSQDALVAADNWEPGSIAERMGQLNFSKFKGCDGCHQDTPDRGGLSGPELHSAWQRLQPAYLSSYIANPVAWDAFTLMPHPGLNDAEVHKLANYLKVIGEKP